jgi:hypothetical protein
MRKTEKPIKNPQDVRDETFLQQHSSQSRSAAANLDQMRTELVKLLELARAGSKAVGPTARAFSSGHSAGLQEAIKIIDRALQADQAARIRVEDCGLRRRGGFQHRASIP